ncbi:MAG: hypothetical protein DRH08_06545 [Deltaproteobacteria bacterium]|nr:MAG: hypothetical protein DRH08_06545 [Deltaproteobacteria bacterium]
MKLKEAIKEAKKLGFNWVGVDNYSLFIYAYQDKPKKSEASWVARSPFEAIGEYSGSKNWKDTLRKVPHV